METDRTGAPGLPHRARPGAPARRPRAGDRAAPRWGRGPPRGTSARPDAGRPGVLTSLSEDPDPIAVRLDLRPWGAGRVLLVEPGAAGLAPRSDLFPSANPLP